MATYTSNFNLKKPATTEDIDVNDINGNMDTIDTALHKTNYKMPYCTTLSDLQTAIVNIVNSMSNGEIVCGYCDIGFYDMARGFDGSKGSYILTRQSGETFNIHLFFGSSEAIAYYYSAAWHWDSPDNKIGVRLPGNTNQVAFDASTMAKIGTWITSHYLQNRWMAVRCTNSGSSNPVIGQSEFGLIYCLSSMNYGWGILMTDNSSLVGGILFGQLAAGTWKWYKPTVTQV